LADINLLNTLENIHKLVEQLAQALLDRQLVMATAESCTGGAIAYFLTNLAGSSQWFDRAYVTYSNQAKQDMLGVSASSLSEHGAVSEQVVEEMARGALTPDVGLSVAVSGIAGPSGGSETKPVGTVCFAWAYRGNGAHSDSELVLQCETCHFNGDRQTVRLSSLQHALQGLLKIIDSK